MNWKHLWEVVLAAGIATTFTDYFLAGDWLRRRFGNAEVWRSPPRNWAIALISPLPFVTSAAFAILAWRLGIHSVHSLILLAAAIWVIGPLPLILTSAAYVRLRAFFAASYAFAWLVRLMIVAILTAKIIR